MMRECSCEFKGTSSRLERILCTFVKTNKIDLRPHNSSIEWYQLFGVCLDYAYRGSSKQKFVDILSNLQGCDYDGKPERIFNNLHVLGLLSLMNELKKMIT